MPPRAGTIRYRPVRMLWAPQFEVKQQERGIKAERPFGRLRQGAEGKIARRGNGEGKRGQAGERERKRGT